MQKNICNFLHTTSTFNLYANMYSFFIRFFLLLLAVTCYSCKTADFDLGAKKIPYQQITGKAEDRFPMVDIVTDNQYFSDKVKINAQMTITVIDVLEYSGTIGIKIMESSIQTFPKKIFSFETTSESNAGSNISLLGLPEGKDWVLQAPYSDKSLMRNVLMNNLSRDLGRYASGTEYIDLYINDEYNGVYVLTEELDRNEHRINIDELREDENDGEDITGGYIIRIDKAPFPNEKTYTDANSFISNYRPLNSINGLEIRFLYDTPDKESITIQQKEYISNYINSFEDALFGENFKDPEIGYAQFIDIQSFIDFFLLNELSNNVDGFRFNVRIIKDRGEKLIMGPIGDFNFSLGNLDYCGGEYTYFWAYKSNQQCSDYFWQIPFWWDRLLQDPKFTELLKSRWNHLRSNILSNTRIDYLIEKYKNELILSGGVQENFDKWPILGEYVWPNNFKGQSYEEEVYLMKTWINKRLMWLDVAISNL